MGQSLKKMKKGTSKGRRTNPRTAEENEDHLDLSSAREVHSSNYYKAREVKREPKKENVADNKNNVKESNQGLMKIFVKVLQKPLITFEVLSSDTVKGLKELIEDEEGIPTYQQMLMFGGQELEDGKKLSDYNITKNSYLVMVMENQSDNSDDESDEKSAKESAEESDEVSDEESDEESDDDKDHSDNTDDNDWEDVSSDEDKGRYGRYKFRTRIQESDEESDEESVLSWPSVEQSEEQSDDDSNEESDEESDKQSDEESDKESVEESLEQSDESEEDSDEEDNGQDHDEENEISQARQMRIEGNSIFGKFKNSFHKGQQKSYLTDAVKCYEEALKLVGNDEKGNKEKASICKNLAISFDYLTQLEERFQSTRLHLWQRALEYFVMAIYYGKRHGKKWLKELCDKFQKCYSNLDSDEQTINIMLNVLYNAGKMNHCKIFCQIARGILLDYGDGVLDRSLQAISDKKYKIGLPLLHEL